MADGAFDGKIVLITGVAEEVGHLLGRAYTGAGSRNVILAVAGGEREVAHAEPAILYEALDGSDPESCRALVKRLVSRFGHVDVLVNGANLSASATSYHRDQAPAETLSSAGWEEGVAALLASTFYCVQAVGRQMLSQGHGVVAILTSVAGFKAVEGHLTASVVHAALMAMTKALGVEWAGRGVRVVGVALPLELGEMSRRTPLRSPVTMQQIAETLLYLTSDEAAYVTAETIVVDGGWSAYQLF